MELNASTIKFADLSSDKLDSWLDIVIHSKRLGSPCFHPVFAEACVKAGRNVHVSVIETDHGDAYLPFEIISAKRAGPLAGVMGDFHGIVSRDGHDIDMVDLIRKTGLKSFAFDHLICEANPPPGSTAALSPVIDLTGGYDVYRENKVQQKSKLFKKIDKYKQGLEKSLGPLQFVHHCDDIELLDRLIRLKSEQYARSGIMNLFGFDWPRSLLTKLLQQKQEGFRGSLSCLYAGDEIVFLHFGMQTTQRFHYWFPAYPTEHSRLSPGIVGLDYLARSVSAEGPTAIDLGKGDNLYKSRFANTETTIFEGEIVPSGLQRWKNDVIDSFNTTVKQSPLLYGASFPIRWLTRHYRYSRRYK